MANLHMIQSLMTPDSGSGPSGSDDDLCEGPASESALTNPA